MKGSMSMYSGTQSFPLGKPTPLDAAIGLSREGRYVGAGLRWWPVALHTMVVCDLLPPSLKIHGWMHDVPECVVGDRPKPVKTPEDEEIEEELLARFYDAFEVQLPTETERRAVHEADRRALHGEIYTVGPPALQKIYPHDFQAEAIVAHYVKEYTYADCLEASGRVPMEFLRQFHGYKLFVPKPKI